MTNETVTKEPQNIFYTTVNDLEEAMKQKDELAKSLNL